MLLHKNNNIDIVDIRCKYTDHHLAASLLRWEMPVTISILTSLEDLTGFELAADLCFSEPHVKVKA